MGTRGKGIVLGAVFALAAGTAVAQGTLAGVETRPVGEGIEVQILGENLSKPKELRVNGNRSYILEFDANLLGRAQRKNVRKGGLSYWNCVWFSARPPKVRVLLAITPEAAPVLEQNEKGWIVSLNTEASATKLEAKPKALPSIPLGTTVPDLKPASQILAELATKTLGVSGPAESASQKSTATSSTIAAVRTQKVSTTKVPPTSPTVDMAMVGADATAKLAVATSAPPAAAKAFVKPKAATVTLDFVNAEVAQILKALALQANVNIVTAPEVKGALTVSLDRVSVEEALDFVTTMTGLRYGRVGNTYMVTSAGRFAETMRTMTKADTAFETRVVPIYSGAGTQIKAAILRSVPQETTEGSFEIVLPSEETKVEKKATVGDGTDTNGEKQGGSGQSTTVESKSTSDTTDPYVVLIGTGSRLLDIEKLVNRLDLQLCNAVGITVPSSSSMAQATYQVRGGSATDLMKAVAGDKNKVGNVEISATPASSTSGQSIVLFGRENEVANVLSTLAQLDSSDEVAAEFLGYDVKFVDPRSLRESLIAAVPGLRATVAPAAAGNPRAYMEGAGKIQGMEVVQNGGSGSEKGGAATAAADVKVKGDTSTNAAEGLGQPFSDYEKVTQPMRLILSGSPDMLDRAREYLAVVDIAPKQVALELRVMELSKEDALKVGLDWSLLTGGTVRSFRINQGLGGTSSTPGVQSGTLGFAGGGTAEITATLDQIADRRNLIARPNLLAIDGRESEIFIGDVVRYVESIVTSQNGTTVTTGEVPVGVRLAVFPRIGGSGSITMDLRPVVSSLKSFTPVPGGGNLPQTSVRIAQSTVNIKSGETIAIGGLILDQDRRIVSGIPILKDLPIVGMLFKRIDNQKIRTEVVMFVTAKIVDPDDRQNAADPRAADKKGGG